MTHDRTGELLDPDEFRGPHRCRNGWLTPPDADNPVPCRICKDAHLGDKIRRGKFSDVNTLKSEMENE